MCSLHVSSEIHKFKIAHINFTVDWALFLLLYVFDDTVFKMFGFCFVQIFLRKKETKLVGQERKI